MKAAPESVVVRCFWPTLAPMPMTRAATSPPVHDGPTGPFAKKVASEAEITQSGQGFCLCLIKGGVFSQFKLQI